MTLHTPDAIFVLAFLTEPGEPTDSTTPHVTFLARAFTTRTVDMSELHQKIQERVSGMSSFLMKVTGVENFGLNGEFTVNTLKCDEDNDRKLHHLLLDLFTEEGYEFTYPQFTGDNFHAHMTVHGDAPHPEGTIISINHLVISRHVGGVNSGDVRNSTPIIL